MVIAAHSLSELSWEDFLIYYVNVLKKTENLFYAGHAWNCGREMLSKKLDKILEDFDLIESHMEEDNTVYNNLYVRKK